jgi:hypothetical protein
MNIRFIYFLHSWFIIIMKEEEEKKYKGKDGRSL